MNKRSELRTKGAKSEVEERLSTVEARLAIVENLLKSKSAALKATDDREAIVAAKVNDIGVQECVILCYGLKGAQKRQQVMKTLDIWGKPYGSWFKGGNFRNRLVNKGILRADDENGEGDGTYSLTMSGQHAFEEKLEQLRKS